MPSFLLRWTAQRHAHLEVPCRAGGGGAPRASNLLCFFQEALSITAISRLALSPPSPASVSSPHCPGIAPSPDSLLSGTWARTLCNVFLAFIEITTSFSCNPMMSPLCWETCLYSWCKGYGRVGVLQACEGLSASLLSPLSVAAHPWVHRSTASCRRALGSLLS